MHCVCVCVYVCMCVCICVCVCIHTCRGKGWQHLLGATKRAFSLFYIFWNLDYRQRFPLKSTELWKYRIQLFGVLKFPLSPLHSTHGWVQRHEWMDMSDHSRRRSDFKYFDVQIGYFSCPLFWETGTPVCSREKGFENLGNPVETCLKITGTQWKLVWNFGSRNYFKSNLLRPWMGISEWTWVNVHEWMSMNDMSECTWWTWVNVHSFWCPFVTHVTWDERHMSMMFISSHMSHDMSHDTCFRDIGGRMRSKRRKRRKREGEGNRTEGSATEVNPKMCHPHRSRIAHVYMTLRMFGWHCACLDGSAIAEWIAHVLITSPSTVLIAVHMCDMTYPDVKHHPFICVTWLIHLCDMTPSYVWYDSFICETWLIHMCGMTHSYV